MPIEPNLVLRQAIRQVPSMKYALAIAGLAAAAAIVVKFVGYDKAAIILISMTFIAMILMYVFSVLVATGRDRSLIPGVVLLYAIILFFCVFLIFTVTAFAISWPKPWAEFLGVVRHDTQPAMLSGGPVELQPGETRTFPVKASESGPLTVDITNIIPDWTGREAQLAAWKAAGKGNTPELYITICEVKESDTCSHHEQRGLNGVAHRDVEAGQILVKFYNFPDSPALQFSTDISYP